MNKTFTTATGRVVEIQPIPPLLIDAVKLRAMQEIEVPPIPTYAVELPDGTILNYAHDAKSIEDPLTAEFEKQAWKVYTEALRHQASHASSKVLELFMIKGVVLSMDDVNSGEWRSIQEYFGVEIPTDPIAVRSHYVKTEILSSADDIQNLMKTLLEASGIDPLILEAAQNSFRNNLRKQEEALERASGSVQPKREGEVVHQLQIQGS